MSQSPVFEGRARIGFSGAGNIFDAYAIGPARITDRIAITRVAEVPSSRYLIACSA